MALVPRTEDWRDQQPSSSNHRQVALPADHSALARMPPQTSNRWSRILEASEEGKGKELITLPISEQFTPHAGPRRPKIRHIEPRRRTSSPPHGKYESQPTNRRDLNDEERVNIKTGESKKAQTSHSIGRKVDSFLTPDSGDLTVHLELDLQEDLEDYMEEWARFSRLGQFKTAKKFFEQSFQHYSKSPYILVQYANLLLQQGKFRAVTELDDGPIYDLGKKSPQYEDLHLLRINWELIQLSARMHTLDSINDVSTLFVEIARVLGNLELAERPIGSTEIKILGLTLQLTSNLTLNMEWLRHGQRLVNAMPTLLRRLYSTLLREGRIWDFHDLLILIPTIREVDNMLRAIFDTGLIASLKKVISDWSISDEHDTPTTLALISILTHMVLEPIHTPVDQCMEIMNLSKPLALSILDHDPTSVRTRPYLRYLLAHSRFIDMTSHRAISSLVDRLDLSPGICFHRHPSQLPIYVPTGAETPYWASGEMSLRVKGSANLVCRAAKGFEDIRTEILSLQELIRLSENPRKEFDRLCELQLAEGDLTGYGQSLASTYLIAKTAPERDTLKFKIADLLSRLDNPQFCDSHWKWPIKMIMYKLQDRSRSQICSLLGKEIMDYQDMDVAVLEQISRKMPELKGWVDQQVAYQRDNSGFRAQNSDDDDGAGQPGIERDSFTRIREDDAGNHQHQTTEVERDSPTIQVAELENQKDAMHIAEEEREELEREVAKLERENRGLQKAESRARKAAKSEREKHTSEIARLKRERDNILREAERERERERVSESRATQLELEKHERQVSELEREAARRLEAEADKYEKQLAAVKEATNVQMTQAASSFELQREAMRKAITDMTYESVRQDEVALRREAEKKEKMLADLRLEGEKLISAISREMAAERENRITMRKLEEKILATTAQADKEKSVSLLVTEKLLEAAERVEMEARERNKQVSDQTGMESGFRAEAEQRDSQAEARKQPQEEPRGETQGQGNDSRPLHFEDAVGRKFVFPFETCKTWVDMKNLINLAFRNFGAMGVRVQAGNYDLLVDDAIILPQLWEFSIKPGSMVTMHMWPTSPSQSTDQESHPGSDESYFHGEHSMEDVYESRSTSLGEGPFQSSSSRLGSQHSSDQVPPPVPEVPGYPDEHPSPPAWGAQSPLLTSSPRGSSVAKSGGSEFEENVSRQTQRIVSDYSDSMRSGIETQGSSGHVPRRGQRLKGFLSTWRRRTFPSGVARTASSSNLSPNVVRGSEEILDE
ncbi:hypothetical protein O1611_g2905 [Lasiodiplodia mahajangana]|uniref:Uncharacterized protein n=1 Tax=Lasiodiplodia mahajangana TaxID=1108764 RepID=A0ACC2JTK0_9PEZI|nr:hypothetical protein O1611_g2905 [Lasiodiplodia mahajangana]